MKVFKNKEFQTRNYECINVVFCEAKSAPDESWVETREPIPEAMQPLWIQNRVQYYGYL